MSFALKALCRSVRPLLIFSSLVNLIVSSVAQATLIDTPLPFNPAIVTPAGVTLPEAAQQAGDLTGLNVATDGVTLVVGAPQAAGGNLNSYGVNTAASTPANPLVVAAPGKVYVYRHDAVGNWVQVATLMASAGADEDRFGSSVAVDGGLIIVGADTAVGTGPQRSTKQGRVYLFEEPTTGWSNTAITFETAELQALVDDGAGNPVPLDNANSYFGHALGIKGSTVVVGQWGSAVPALYVYEQPVNGWASAPLHSQVATLQPIDPATGLPPQQFGLSLAIDTDLATGLQTVVSGGDLIRAGGGAVYLFEQPAAGWASLGVITPSPATLTLGLSPTTNAIDGGTRSFGFAVDIEGDTIVASGMRFDVTPVGGVKVADAGAVFVYEKDPLNGWPLTESAMLTAPNPQPYQSFGRSVALGGERILVGSFTNHSGLSDPMPGITLIGKAAGPVTGSAFIFSKPAGSRWANYTGLAEEWVSPAGSNDDMFGYSVAACHTTFVAGGFALDEDLGLDGTTDFDVGSAAVKAVTVNLRITNTLRANTQPQSGDRLSYTITVENLDQIDTANGVVVSDLLPAGLLYVSASATQGSCAEAAPNQMRCDLGSIAPGNSAVITLLADVVDATNIDHTAGIATNESLATNAVASNKVNVAPLADAGPAQMADEGAVVTLSGSGSDADGTIVSYLWQQLSGEPVVLSSANSAAASFTAPGLTATSQLPLSFMLTVTDNGGVAATATLEVAIRDITPPEVFPNDPGPISLGYGQAFSDSGATATDNVDTNLSVVTDLSQLNSGVVGSYPVIYRATDSAGNVGNASVSVNVVDSVAPALTLLGENPLLLKVGESFNDPGVSVSDNADPAPRVSNDAETAVDTSVAGSYSVTYTAVDASQNSVSVTRIVVVEAAVVAPGTTDPTVTDPTTPDSGSTDTGSTDSGTTDSSSSDSGSTDTGSASGGGGGAFDPLSLLFAGLVGFSLRARRRR